MADNSSLIALACARGKKSAVMGLAASGLASAEALLRGGAEVIGWDDNEAARKRARARAIPLADLSQDSVMRECDFCVSAPGVPLDHPALQAARLWGKPVLGDIELLWQQCRNARLIAVTGTNGKSSTTALLGHIFESCGRKAQVGGNLGTPVLSFNATEPAESLMILELSSFQLELIDRARFAVGVLLNISPDHLDRHSSMSAYIAAKMRLARNARAEDLLVCGIDDEATRHVALSLLRAGLTVRQISARHVAPGGVWIQQGTLYDDLEGEQKPYPLAAQGRGKYKQSLAAAYSVARLYGGFPPAAILEAIASFEGLPHRLSSLGEHRAIHFVNDSKATNIDSVRHALELFSDSAVFWLAGGQLKRAGGETQRTFAPLVAPAACVQIGVFFGEARQDFARYFRAQFPCFSVPTLSDAFALATEKALQASARRKVVLLSPACASFDQFANFAARGEAFESLMTAWRSAWRSA